MLREPRCPECGVVFRWQALLHIGCPRCGENLSAVDGDSCPRCDLPLAWDRLLTEAPALSRRLFEFSRHPMLRGLLTIFGVLFPRRFWRRIPLEANPNVPRLRWFRRIVFGAGSLALFAYVAAELFQAVMGGLRGWQLVALPYRWSFVLGVFVGMPLLAPLVLRGFTPTLARFRIRRDQMLRCAAYASTGTLWVGATLVFVLFADVAIAWSVGIPFAVFSRMIRVVPMAGVEEWLRPRRPPRRRAVPWTWSAWAWRTLPLVFDGFLIALGLWYWVFLYISLRQYLRLDRWNALALIVSTFAIVTVAIPTVVTLFVLVYLLLTVA